MDLDQYNMIAEFEEDERQITAIREVFLDYERGTIQDKLQGFDAIREILEAKP